MNWSKLAPWNWFKDEEASAPRPPARPEAGDPISLLRTDMDRLFDELSRRLHAGTIPFHAGPAPAPLRPSIDISEGKKAYTVRAEVPGMEPEDLSVEVEDHTLVLRGEKRRESEDEGDGYHCVERSYGAVQRVLSLPDDADGESIDAEFRNGVLTLKIPKLAPRTSSARRIEIRHS